MVFFFLEKYILKLTKFVRINDDVNESWVTETNGRQSDSIEFSRRHSFDTSVIANWEKIIHIDIKVGRLCRNIGISVFVVSSKRRQSVEQPKLAMVKTTLVRFSKIFFSFVKNIVHSLCSLTFLEWYNYVTLKTMEILANYCFLIRCMLNVIPIHFYILSFSQFLASYDILRWLPSHRFGNVERLVGSRWTWKSTTSGIYCIRTFAHSPKAIPMGWW